MPLDLSLVKAATAKREKQMPHCSMIAYETWNERQNGLRTITCYCIVYGNLSINHSGNEIQPVLIKKAAWNRSALVVPLLAVVIDRGMTADMSGAKEWTSMESRRRTVRLVITLSTPSVIKSSSPLRYRQIRFMFGRRRIIGVDIGPSRTAWWDNRCPRELADTPDYGAVNNCCRKPNSPLTIDVWPGCDTNIRIRQRALGDTDIRMEMVRKNH